MSDTPVALYDDYYCGPGFNVKFTPTHRVPQEQVDRWKKAMADYERMQDEISAILYPDRKKA